MKKILTICFTFFVSLLLVLSGSTAASANSKAKVKGYTIYKTKIKKITENEYHDWVVKGTTKAPDKAKIIATTNNKNNVNYGDLASESKSETSWAKVKNHKFTAIVEPVSITGVATKKADSKYKVQLFAIKNYKKSFDEVTVPKKIIKKAKKNFKPKTFTLSKKQADYENSLDSDSSSSSSSSKNTAASSSEDDAATEQEAQSNGQSITYAMLEKSADKYIGKPYYIRGQVAEAHESHGVTTLRVNVTDEGDGFWDDDFYVLYADTTPAVEDDIVNIYGTISDNESYETQLGAQRTIPSMIADKINVE